MKKTSLKQLSFSYALLIAFYWCGDVFIYGFASVLLLNKGFTNLEIGFILSLSSILSVLAQSFLSDLADRHFSFSIKNGLLLLLIIQSICLILVICFSVPHRLYFFLYILLLGFEWALQTFLNTVITEWQSYGLSVSYGPLRSLGSLGYAATSLLTGLSLKYLSLSLLLPAYFITRIILIICSLLLYNPRKQMKEHLQDQSVCSGGANTPPALPITAFFKKYPVLIPVFSSFALLWINSTLINSYMTQIMQHLHGDTAYLGLANFSASFSEIPVMLLSIWWLKRFSYKTYLRIAALFYLLESFLIWHAKSPIQLVIAKGFQGLSFGIFTVVSILYVAQIVDNTDNAKGQAMLCIFTRGISGLVSSILGGILLDYFSVPSTLLFCLIIALIGNMILFSYDFFHIPNQSKH